MPRSSSTRTRRRRDRAFRDAGAAAGRRRISGAGAAGTRGGHRAVRRVPFFSLFFMLSDPCRAQGNLLLRLEPSSAVAGLTNPTQALIRAINAFRAGSPSLPRPAEAASAARGISIGKGMKEEEYYLALYDQDGLEVRFWRVRGG